MKNRAMLAAALAAALLTAVPAQAASVTIGPGGVTVNPGPGYHDNRDRRDHRPRARISADDAVAIARRNGMRTVSSVDRVRGDFEVSGRDRHRNRLSILVDGRTGAILDVDRRG